MNQLTELSTDRFHLFSIGLSVNGQESNGEKR